MPVLRSARRLLALVVLALCLGEPASLGLVAGGRCECTTDRCTCRKVAGAATGCHHDGTAASEQRDPAPTGCGLFADCGHHRGGVVVADQRPGVLPVAVAVAPGAENGGPAALSPPHDRALSQRPELPPPRSHRPA